MLRPKYDLGIQYSREGGQQIAVSIIKSRVTEDLAESLLNKIVTELSVEGVKLLPALGKYLRITWSSHYIMHEIVKEILLVIDQVAEIELVGFAPAIGGSVQSCDVLSTDFSKLLPAKESFEFLVRLKVEGEQ